MGNRFAGLFMENKMPSIVIRLDPEKLQNPNLDLRYDIPDLLAERSAGLIKEDGYDYEPHGDAMQIYLSTSDLNSAVPRVVAFLETEHLYGNHLAHGAQVGISEADGSDAREFRVVYPPGASGLILPPAFP
jgi:hypothetical protein